MSAGDQKFDVAVAARDGAWKADLLQATPSVDATGRPLLVAVVAENDCVHLQCELAGRTAYSAFGLRWSVEPQLGFQAVDLVEVLGGGMVNELGDPLGVRIKLRSRGAAHCRSQEYETAYPSRVDERGVDSQPAAH